MDREVSPVFYANLSALLDPKIKIIVNQGGTRSGKTYSLTQLLITIAEKTANKNEISVVSLTMPHLKKGAIKDFKEIMYNWQMYTEKKWNGTDFIYRFTPENYIEFFSTDNGNKVRGTNRDYLFINEANLLDLDTFMQLLLRTRKKVFIDYNPSDEFHWIYDHVLTRDDCKMIHSTYLDNYDFLPTTQIEEIERLKDMDDNYWKIYGLGERAKAANLIYPKFDTEWKDTGGEKIYGLDFGFNNQTALVEIQRYERHLYIKELIYERELTNSQLIPILKSLNLGLNNIYADGAEPQRIQEIYNAGFNIHKADKSVNPGIDYVKGFILHIHKESTNAIREHRAYKWKVDKNGRIIDEPVKFMDHTPDAVRYGCFTHGPKFWSDFVSVFPTMALKNKDISKNTFRNSLSLYNN
jgi:phage terminase large subunit